MDVYGTGLIIASTEICGMFIPNAETHNIQIRVAGADPSLTVSGVMFYGVMISEMSTPVPTGTSPAWTYVPGAEIYGAQIQPSRAPVNTPSHLLSKEPSVIRPTS